MATFVIILFIVLYLGYIAVGAMSPTDPESRKDQSKRS